MLPDPSTSPAEDSGGPGGGQEPGDYPPPEWPDADLPGPDLPGTGQPGAVYPDAGPQGLFLSVPAGSFDADRFAQSGPAAEMPPDPLLATIIDAVTGPDGPGMATLSDDQLIGVIAAVRRLESRVAWYTLTAVAEFAARWGGEVAGAEFAAGQLACELHLTSRSAAVQLDYATAVTARLPRCLAALGAGLLHPVHLRIIDEETQILSAGGRRGRGCGAGGGGGVDDVREAALGRAPDGPGPGSRRGGAAEGGRAAGRARADVPEPSGNAGMIAQELPCAEVLASWQHIEQRALDLRAAGIPGTLEELRVRAYLDLLQERHTSLPAPGPGPAGTPATARPDDTGPATETAAARVAAAQAAVPRSGPGGSGSGGQPGADAGPSLAALVTITVPWSAPTGQSAAPAEVGGFGTVDAADARDLAAAAARDPRTRWCVTALHPDGTAAAHGCAPGRHPPPGTTHLTAAPGPGPRTRSAARNPPAGLDQRAAHPDDPDHPRQLRPPPRRDRLPAQPQTPAPGPRPQRPVHRTGLRPARRPLRPGPHHRLGPRRTHLRMRPRPAMPPPPPVQASPRMAAGTTRTRRPDLAHPSRPHLHHQTHPVPRLVG